MGNIKFCSENHVILYLPDNTGWTRNVDAFGKGWLADWAKRYLTFFEANCTDRGNMAKSEYPAWWRLDITDHEAGKEIGLIATNAGCFYMLSAMYLCGYYDITPANGW